MNNCNPLVSIILPTYNVVDYLKICLDSIAKQTYKNIEVLIVIDGATDGSYELAKNYCKKDSRFSVIWQENTGSGPARSNGLRHANGDLIAFVDPDDWVKPEYIETLVNIQQRKDFDMVLSGFERHLFIDDVDNNKGIRSFVEEREFLTLGEVRAHYVDLRCKIRLLNSPWAKLFKASIIQENSLEFPDLRRSQDIYFNTLYYNHIQSLAETTYAGYCYRDIYGQWKKLKPDYYKTSEILFNQMYDMLEKWGIVYNQQDVFNLFLLNIISNVESNLTGGSSVEEIRENPYVQFILNNSKPENFYHRVERKLIEQRRWFFLKMYINLKRLYFKHR